jgi:hypothetical protein
MDAILARVLTSWRLSGCCNLGRGATALELKQAEKKLGCKFPAEVADLYRQCNGADILGGNLVIDPLDGKTLSLVQSGDFLRKAEWPIPEDALVFGGDGGDELYALWLPRDRVERPIVIEVGSIFQPGSFSIVGTSLPRFLRSRTAYYLFLKSAMPSHSTRLRFLKGLEKANPINLIIGTLTTSFDGQTQDCPTCHSRPTTRI